jgi:hypothetical protein
MARNICDIPREWSMEEYRRHTCADGSHAHRSIDELRPKLNAGLVIWLVDNRDRGKKHFSVVKLLPTREELSAGACARAGRPGPPASEPITKGLSPRYGAYLAISVYFKRSWALAMLEIIRERERLPR